MAKATPRFRKELPAAATETDGVPCVQVTDPETGISFTFYEFEYDLAHQLDGQDVEDVMAWAVANYQTDLTAEAIDEFAVKLGELGFLEGVAPAARPGVEASPRDSADIEWNVVPAVDSAPTMTGFAGATGSGPTDTSGVTELSSDALTELSDSGPVSSTSGAGIPKAVPYSGSGATNPFSSSTGITRSFRERRQPPGGRSPLSGSLSLSNSQPARVGRALTAAFELTRRTVPRPVEQLAAPPLLVPARPRGRRPSVSGTRPASSSRCSSSCWAVAAVATTTGC